MHSWWVLLALSAQENNVPKDLPNPVTLTITGAQTGDRGCYVSGTEVGEAKKSWELMAEHGCESALVVGESYVLTWSPWSVLAAACEGNMDCPLSDTEPLVTGIRPVQGPAAPPPPVPVAPEAPEAPK